MNNSSTTGFRMCPTNTTPDVKPTAKSDYGKVLTDQYGRTYVQTVHGRIY